MQIPRLLFALFVSQTLASESGTTCTNTCLYEQDGICDDGGPGSELSDCSFGTDCTDCGGRGPSPSLPPPSDPPSPSLPPPSGAPPPPKGIRMERILTWAIAGLSSLLVVVSLVVIRGRQMVSSSIQLYGRKLLARIPWLVSNTNLTTPTADMELVPNPNPVEKPFQPNVNDPKLGKPTPEAKAVRSVQRLSKSSVPPPPPRLVTRTNRQ
jgi:hypothetical protein